MLDLEKNIADPENPLKLYNFMNFFELPCGYQPRLHATVRLQLLNLSTLDQLSLVYGLN